jgi:hypothetical protein
VEQLNMECCWQAAARVVGMQAQRELLRLERMAAQEQAQAAEQQAKQELMVRSHILVKILLRTQAVEFLEVLTLPQAVLQQVLAMLVAKAEMECLAAVEVLLVFLTQMVGVAVMVL